MTTPVTTHYFVRHAEDGRDGHLTERGIAQAEAARDYLLTEGLGAAAILLSSDAVRAQDTAKIIGDGLGVEVKVVERLSDISNHPERKKLDYSNSYLEDFEVFIAGLEKEFLETQEAGPLVMVTHSPLLSRMLINVRDYSDPENGRVVKWPPEKPEATTKRFRFLRRHRR